MPSNEKEPIGIKIKSVLNPPDKAIELGIKHAGVRGDIGYKIDMADGKNGEWIVTLTRGHFNDLFRVVKNSQLVSIIEFVFDNSDVIPACAVKEEKQ